MIGLLVVNQRRMFLYMSSDFFDFVFRFGVVRSVYFARGHCTWTAFCGCKTRRVLLSDRVLLA